MENAVRFHRVLRAAPEKVYRAFLDPDAMAKWLPPNGFTGKVHQADGRVGGSYRMSFTNFSTGKSHSFGGRYLELKPNARLRYTDRFDDPNLPGEMTVTVNLKLLDMKKNALLFEEHSFREKADFQVQNAVSQTIAVEEVAVQTAATEIGRAIVSLTVSRF